VNVRYPALALTVLLLGLPALAVTPRPKPRHVPKTAAPRPKPTPKAVPSPPMPPEASPPPTDEPQVVPTPEPTPKPTPPPAKSQASHRVSLSAGGALNTFFMPALQAKFGVRLPLGDDDWELLAGYGPINGVFGLNDPPVQHATLALRWYLFDDPDFQVFWGTTAGFLFQLPGQVAGADVPFAGRGPTIMGGPGINIMPWRHFGFTVALEVGYPFIIRPELDLRLAF
jgi:hypothetical protein